MSQVGKRNTSRGTAGVSDGKVHLDLAQSVAKLRRATVHMKALQAEDATLGDAKPFTLRLGEINQGNGSPLHGK